MVEKVYSMDLQAKINWTGSGGKHEIRLSESAIRMIGKRVIKCSNDVIFNFILYLQINVSLYTVYLKET